MKLKLVFVALFVISVGGVPLSEVKLPLIEDEDSIPFLMNKVGAILADDGLNYRLPNETRPIRYDLWLKTDVDKNEFDFEGRVKIHVSVIEATNMITLHYRQLSFSQINLLNTDESVASPNLQYSLNETLEFLHITLPTTRQAGETLVVDISYTGNLRLDGSGFYRANYTNNGVVTWFATTQFEMTDARHAMPCYDEPGIRAVTGLQIQHGSVYNAVSNMPVQSRVSIGNGYVVTTFDDTPPMQSYLLAFIISDFGYVSNNDPRIEQRIYANPALIAQGHGEFSVHEVDGILRKLEEHLGVLYPLPKMDHAAITNYIWGAMENFGLITYQDRSLLFNPETDAISRQKSILELIAHEYAHQWFGNIVSPSWWSYNWLNEGFATLFSNYIPYLVYPESDHWDRFQSAVDRAYSADTPTANKPLNLYVQDPTSIRNKFDTIAYQKGGTMLRMFMEALSVPTFTKGLNYYLTEMYFKSATPQDLHRNLQKAYDEDFPSNGANLNTLMSTWEDQAGYPNVHVTKSGNNFVLTQARYPSGPEIYSIPVSYALQASDFDTKTVRYWLTTKTGTIASPNSWIIVNVQLTGYYRVTYDASIWSGLTDALLTNSNTISKFHKEQMFKDMRASLVSEAFGASHGLRLLSYLKTETLASVWTQAAAVEDIFATHLSGTETLTKYYEYMAAVIQPHKTRLGLEEKTSDTTNDVELRNVIRTMSCKFNQEDCFTLETTRLTNFVQRGEGPFDLCYGLRKAPETLHQTFIDRLLATTVAAERTAYINGLGCSLDEKLINKFLSLSIDTANSLTAAQRRSVIESTARRSEIALKTVLTFIHENYATIGARIPGTLPAILTTVTGYINHEDHFDTLKSIIALAKTATLVTEANEQTIVAVYNENKKWLTSYLEGIETVLGAQDDSTTVAPTTVAPTTVGSTTVGSTTVAPTTLGAGSLIASFAVVVSCALFKILV